MHIDTPLSVAQCKLTCCSFHIHLFVVQNNIWLPCKQEAMPDWQLCRTCMCFCIIESLEMCFMVAIPYSHVFLLPWKSRLMDVFVIYSLFQSIQKSLYDNYILITFLCQLKTMYVQIVLITQCYIVLLLLRLMTIILVFFH